MTLREYLRRHEGDLIHLYTREDSMVCMPTLLPRNMGDAILDADVTIWNHAPAAEVCSVTFNEKVVPFVTYMGGWCYPNLTPSLVHRFAQVPPEQLA